MRTQEKLIYTNERGESIEFSPASSYHVNFKDVTGLSDVRNAIYSTNSMGQDGDTYLGYRIESRDIDIVGYIKERDKQAAQNLRRKLNRILNPQYEATLTYVFGDFRRVIGCKIDDAPIFKRKPIFEQFTVSLSCLNPFWREETETREDIATWIGGFEFPVPDGLELYDGWEIGYRQPSLIVNVYNSGDVKSGIRIEFRAIGAVTNPVLLNVDTREFIKLNISLVAGDVLTVSTGYGEKAVKLNRGGMITDAFRYTNSGFATSKGWYWWLRTPYSSNAHLVRSVYSDGSLSYDSAYNGLWGVRPLCNLKSSILVSDSPNSDGNYTVIYNSAPSAPPSITAPATCYSGQNINISCAAATDPDGDALTYCFERSYNSGAWTQVQASASRTFTEAVSTAWNTLKYRVRAKDSYGNYSAYTTSGDIAVIHNQPPVISGSNADLGTKRGDFTYQYSVTDPDGDTVNVVEKIDGKTIATKNAITLGATQTLSVSGNTFTALTNAQHTITITATDSAGNSAVRTLTFTKSIAGFVITLSTPLEANSQPTRANIKVTRDIPAGGTFKVEATNNPFDASPVWEDCTNAVVQGVAHVFTNKINTAAQYGMNIRVTVQRGDALTACWVSGIGGNFE